MSNRKNVRIKEPSEIELDIETSSSEGFSDPAFGSENEEEEEDISKALAHINITEHLSTLELPDVLLETPEDPFKTTDVVIKFHHNVRLAALLWFIERVTAPKSKGGAELLLLREPYYGKPREGLVFHVTAATWRHLEVAQHLDIKKLDYTMDQPTPREFKLNEIFKFMSDDMQPEDILTPAEKQMVVMHELKHLHSRPGEKHVPGYEKYKLVTGCSIFHVYLTKHLITSYFALHEEKGLNELGGKWFWDFFEDPPYENIRAYFGDQTCLYFNFVAYYTYWLTLPATFGLLLAIMMPFISERLFQFISIPFCLMNMIFVTIFLVFWQRHQSTITYKWGTIHQNLWEEPRENYHGKLGLDPITGSIQRRYPYYKTFVKTYMISFSLVAISSGLAIWMMYVFQQLDKSGKKYAKEQEAASDTTVDIYFWKYGFPMIPLAGYSCCVFLTTKIYRKFANVLTEWENHRTQSQFQRHLVSKMVVFDVVNNFSVLYYTAFIQGDHKLLRERLFSMLAIVEVLVIVDQCIRPIVFRTGTAKMHEFLESKEVFQSLEETLDYPYIGIGDMGKPAIPYPGLESAKVSVMEIDDPRVKISKVEGTMDPYDTEVDFDEYLALFLQFGYTFIFSAVYPAAAIYAFLCNNFILVSSLFKRREVYQRTMAKRASSIGAWKEAFQAIALIAVMTNCALIGKNPSLRNHFPQFTDNQWFFLFVCIEHFILVLQYMVSKIIPKIPYKVKVGMASMEFKSHQALKREQATQTRRRVTRYFAPINEKLMQKYKAQQAQNSQKPASKTSSNKQQPPQSQQNPDENKKQK